MSRAPGATRPQKTSPLATVMVTLTSAILGKEGTEPRESGRDACTRRRERMGGGS